MQASHTWRLVSTRYSRKKADLNLTPGCTFWIFRFDLITPMRFQSNFLRHHSTSNQYELNLEVAQDLFVAFAMPYHTEKSSLCPTSISP